MNKSELNRGTKIEMEHATTIKKFMKKGSHVRSIAKNIAKDHLSENPNYYKELIKMERKLNKKKK